jgi:hypothetical protein
VTWLLAASVLQGKLIHMQLDEIKKFVDRYPFRPFSVRLSNGASYTFRELRDFGAPKDCHVLVVLRREGLGVDRSRQRRGSDQLTRILQGNFFPRAHIPTTKVFHERTFMDWR